MTELDRYRVSSWTAEFRDRRVEHSFREHAQQETARFVKWTVLVAGAFFFVFALTDYLALGLTLQGSVLLGVRSVTVLLALGVCAWVAHAPSAAMSGVAVTLFEAWLLVAFAVVVSAREATLAVYGMSMITLLTGIYLLIPNRLPYMLALALGGSVGFFVLLFTTKPVDPDGPLLDMLMLVALMNLFGWAAARRLAVARREQYRLLAHAEGANASLQREVDRRRLLEVELERLAATDSLTGVFNRRRFFELSRRELEHARRHDRRTAVMMLDLDHFKHINDDWGHAVGDAALVQVAAILRRELRGSDLVGRFGGEEFAITLPESGAAAAEHTARRLCEAIAEARLDEAPQVRLSATVGVAVGADGDMAALLAQADRALYAGKGAGRGCVVLAPESVENGAAGV